FSAATAERLWTAFEGSGRYSFNKSHTSAYGVIAYQTAYLKANWPAEFGAAVLRFTGSGSDKAHLRVATIRSLRAEGIEVMAPDINASDEHTVAREGKVWIGLGEIKGVGSIASEIVAERTRSGPFSSMADVATRVVVAATTAGGKRKSVTSAQLSALAQAGAFDSFGGYRLGQVIASRAVSKDPEVRIPAMEYSVLEKAARQRGVILAVTGTHPTKALSRQVAALYRAGPDDDAAAKPPRGLHRLPGQDGARVHTGGVVSAFSERLTRKGSWMVTLELENAHTSIGCVGFADVHADLKEIGMPEVGDLVEIRGRVRLREVEREVIDEATGQASTQMSLEHSIYLSGLEYMEVDDPDRDAEGVPELAVGRMLSDGVADSGAAVPLRLRQSPPATDTEVGSVSGGLAEDEEVFEPITARPGGAEAARRAAPESAATSRSRGAPATVTGSLAGHSSLEAVDLSEIAASSQWTRLREVLSQATGEGFALAWPRQGTLRGRTGEGSFLRVETERGSVKVPVSVQRRLADLVADGRLPVFVAASRLRCVVLDPCDWQRQLQTMADAIHSGAIDPAVTSIDAPAATVNRAR
ncbi:MAG: hypothetical protein L0G94_16480, partial [Brachybacterium sp.]|nr:hypothetical protein [Brachybacterium sp.]